MSAENTVTVAEESMVSIPRSGSTISHYYSLLALDLIGKITVTTRTSHRLAL